ncbi:hypothetical protein [Petroclostridium sp. X23]|uniref:hypothetical protein n=1 Tax=Petroclostridium sp. X23 TaxID=3045146 RepID=UPI0032C02B5A
MSSIDKFHQINIRHIKGYSALGRDQIDTCVNIFYNLFFNFYSTALGKGKGIIDTSCQISPMVVGFILAPLPEENLRRSLMRTGVSFMPILTSPIAGVFLVLTVVMVVIAFLNERKEAKKAKASAV